MLVMLLVRNTYALHLSLGVLDCCLSPYYYKKINLCNYNEMNFFLFLLRTILSRVLKDFVEKPIPIVVQIYPWVLRLKTSRVLSRNL